MIAVYPNFLDEGYRHVPNHLFLDLDLKLFAGDEIKLDTVLEKTLQQIREYLPGVEPTIIWSGGGYHLHVPLGIEEAFEDIPEFSKFEEVSIKFLRYAERTLSLGNSDPSHNVSFKSCLCRVPGSTNTKYTGETAKVRILKEWNGVRAKPTKQFISDFMIELAQKNANTIITNRKKKRRLRKLSSHSEATTTWINKLLQIQIHDFRKQACDLIIVPYLIVRLGITDKDQIYNTVMEWLDKCDKLYPLSPSKRDFENRIRYRINYVLANNVPPMSWTKLQENNPQLCEILAKLKV
jgi:hypothetical protein